MSTSERWCASRSAANRLDASEPTVALPQESLRRELARLESDLDAQAVGSPALLPFAL